jgi:glutamate-5-semialdehyde dehydrogenase
MPMTTPNDLEIVRLNEMVTNTKQAVQQFSKLTSPERDRLLAALVAALHQQSAEILEANTLDLEAGLGNSSSPTNNWRKLTSERLEQVINLLERLQELPLARAPMTTTPATYYRFTPLGQITLVIDAIPEVLLLAVGMCLKTGNVPIIRYDPGISHCSRAIATIIQTTLINHKLSAACCQLVPPDVSLGALLSPAVGSRQIIVYGKSDLVEQVERLASVPVIVASIGNCYLYWSASSSWELARNSIIDSHIGEPDAVNAIEKVLIQPEHKSSSLVALWNSLQEKGFQLLGDEHLVNNYPDYLQLSAPESWSKPYFSKAVAFKSVDNLAVGITYINQHSSNHADSIITELFTEAQQFVAQLETACVYINTSPRFQRYTGNHIFLGIASQRSHHPGFISLERMMTAKPIIYQ